VDVVVVVDGKPVKVKIEWVVVCDAGNQAVGRVGVDWVVN